MRASQNKFLMFQKNINDTLIYNYQEDVNQI